MRRLRRPRSERPASSRSRFSLLVRILTILAVLLAGFLLGFYLFFPEAILAQRLEQEIENRTGAQVTIGRLSLDLPPGLKASEVHLAGGPPLESLSPLRSVSLHPLWSALLKGRAGVDLEIERGAGRLNLELTANGGIEAVGTDFPLAVPLTASGSLQALGTLRSLELETAYPLEDQTRSRLRLTLAEVVLQGLETLGAGQNTLPLGTITLSASGNGRVVKIDTLESAGGQMQLTGDGQIILATPLGRSRANLSFGLRPAADVDPALIDLLGLFGEKGRDGVLRFRLRGSFAQAGLG